MARLIKYQEMMDIVIGATYLGAGGGGSPVDALKLVEELESLNKTEVMMLDPQEMGENEWAVVVAGVGAPKALRESKNGPDMIAAFSMMQNLAALSNLNLKYILPVEIGSFNTIVPIYVAAIKGVPLVDADGCGRSVPEFATTLFAIYDVPNRHMTMGATNGDSLVIALANPLDHAGTENIARHVCMAYGMKAGVCCYPVNKAIIQDCLVTQSVSLSIAVGQAFRAAKSVKELSAALAGLLKAKEIFIGQITGLEVKTVGGFDLGLTTIKGTDAYAGQSLTIGVKNENMLIRDQSGKVTLTVPDLISLVEVTSLKPLTNADTEVGQQVAVYGTPAPKIWLKSPKGFDCWRHILEKFDYPGGYVSLK